MLVVQQHKSQTLALSLLCSLAAICCLLSHHRADALLASKQDEGKAILADIKKYDSCVVSAVFSFIYPDSLPPKSMTEFQASCRRQSEAFKCIKDKTKGSLPLLRRGLLTFTASRQRHHRRYCTNLESEQTKRFVQATTCLVQKRFQPMKNNDALLVQNLMEIARRNYNDSTIELKQICCSFHNFRKAFYELVGDECASHKHMAEELYQAIVTDDITLVCEDEEKMTKVCPKLEPLGVKVDPNFKLAPGRSGAGLGLYLIATLGEPTDEAPDI